MTNKEALNCKRYIRQLIKISCITLIIIGFILFLLISIENGIINTHQNECLKWKQWEKTITSHYTVNWQKEQCQQFGIYFNN